MAEAATPEAVFHVDVNCKAFKKLQEQNTGAVLRVLKKRTIFKGKLQ